MTIWTAFCTAFDNDGHQVGRFHITTDDDRGFPGKAKETVCAYAARHFPEAKTVEVDPTIVGQLEY